MRFIETEHYNWYTRPDIPEPRTGERPNNTEQAYIPLRVQVKRMKEAGESLEVFKRQLYDDLIGEIDEPTIENE